jgi:hypothetical protein
MRQTTALRENSGSTNPDLPDGKVLLLGVLSLTARFHPELVAHHSPPSSSRPSDPLAASEYYAAALAAAFGPSGKDLTNPSIERVQALLMLGLYEWGQTRGMSAWVYVGIAMRMAQSMGLAYEDDPDRHTFKSPAGAFPDPRWAGGNSKQLIPHENASEKEVRRRTLWSCFIMDRMLSSGKYRPTMIQGEKLRVQLPCSDEAFMFSMKVQTGFLSREWAKDMVKVEEPDVQDDGVLSRFIRLVEIWGRFSEWSHAGGRRTETLPPWDHRTEFFKLRQQLEDFRAALPSKLKFTQLNLIAHISSRTSTHYASMHTLYSLCLIMLHREYIPFVPLRCQKPQGPLDEPTFPREKYDIPEGFWEKSAETMFKAAKDIMDIVRTCQDNDALPESAQIGFAVWTAAFVGVYSVHFPYMDARRYMRGQSQDPGSTGGDVQNKGDTGLTVKILGQMVLRLKMAKGYLKTIGKMHKYYDDIKNEYYSNIQQNRPLPVEQAMRIRFGGQGGGLEEYKVLEKELKEFGSLEDTDKNPPSDGSDTHDQTRSRASTNDIGPGSSVNGELMQGVEGMTLPRSSGAWAPINAANTSIEEDDRPKFNAQGVGYAYGMNYNQPPGQISHPPSLISPSNGDSTPGLNSPYGRSDPNSQGQAYQNVTQPQHIATYPPIAQHTRAIMAPPSTQAEMSAWTGDQSVYNQQKHERFIEQQESINMGSSGLDNFAQAYPMEAWSTGQEGILPNYLQAIWTHDQNLSWG